MFIVQFATVVTLSAAMQIKFFQYPNCIQQSSTFYAFSDICTSGYQGNDLALTTCDIDKTGNGTITASYFYHSGQYLPPMCNNTIQFNLTATGWGVCTPTPPIPGVASFMFGDESEKIQCASSQNQGAFLYSPFRNARVCAALQYTIVTSMPLTSRNVCLSNGGLNSQAFYLNKKKKAVSLSFFDNFLCVNTSIAYSFPSMPLDGSCVNSTVGNYISGALPCKPYPPVQTNEE